jgi:hypothetical protein
MPTLYSVAAFLVVAVYLVWRAWAQAMRQRQEGLLRRRVAYLLWVLAESDDGPALSWEASRPAEDSGWE